MCSPAHCPYRVMPWFQWGCSGHLFPCSREASCQPGGSIWTGNITGGPSLGKRLDLVGDFAAQPTPFWSQSTLPLSVASPVLPTPRGLKKRSTHCKASAHFKMTLDLFPSELGLHWIPSLFLPIALLGSFPLKGEVFMKGGNQWCANRRQAASQPAQPQNLRLLSSG